MFKKGVAIGLKLAGLTHDQTASKLKEIKFKGVGPGSGISGNSGTEVNF